FLFSHGQVFDQTGDPTAAMHGVETAEQTRLLSAACQVHGQLAGQIVPLSQNALVRNDLGIHKLPQLAAQGRAGDGKVAHAAIPAAVLAPEPNAAASAAKARLSILPAGVSGKLR